MTKLEWTKIGEGDWTTKKGNRVFRLQRERYGVLGIGSAYYLKTKLIDESEFKHIEPICVSGDNHGEVPDKRLLVNASADDKQYFIFYEHKHMGKLCEFVERDYINTMY